MSLSRSPSPQRGGGWASPGLTAPYGGGAGSGSSGGGRSASSGRASPMRGAANGSPSNVSWASAQARSAEVRGYSGFAPRGSNFISRHARRVSSNLANLPIFRQSSFAEKEKLGRGRWAPGAGNRFFGFFRMVGRGIWRLRLRLLLVLSVLLLWILFYVTPAHRWYRRTSWLGGGDKFVIILAANQGGGVMEWKGPREWAIERDSVKNKRAYAKRWGYNLEIVDMTTKKRYAHEWRESWEKVDNIRNTMRKYPHAQWFWWLDLNTFIMEPSYSLQSHVFNKLSDNTYRDVTLYNPLNIEHPLNDTYLDPETRSRIGDGLASSINLIVPQDCGGFNLGSFFVRRSIWTDRLLDIWWDPVGYEQKHMEWEHKEQDALEYMYRNQPWVRPHVAFVPQRRVNSFPPGACGDKGEDAKIHYRVSDRDFLVNMAGCEWGRDCWGEMYNYRQLSNQLNRNRWERLKDLLGKWVKNWKEGWKREQKEGAS